MVTSILVTSIFPPHTRNLLDQPFTPHSFTNGANSSPSGSAVSESPPPGRAPPSQTCYGELVPHPSQAPLPLSFPRVCTSPPWMSLLLALQQSSKWSANTEGRQSVESLRGEVWTNRACRQGLEAAHEALVGEAEVAKLHQSQPTPPQFPDFLLW